MSLASLFKGKGPNGFGFGSTAEDVSEGLDLSGKTYLLTGCNSGLGLESLRVLGLRGAHVIAAARTVEKAEKALKETGADGTPVACELSSPSSVRACVEAVKGVGRKLDGILGNAGIMALPKLKVEHGLDLQFLTNHIGHFILVTGLVEQLTEDGRVILTSSRAHHDAPKEGIQFDNLDGSKGYSSWANYGQSKLANVLMMRHLAKQFEGTNRVANSLHPGVIATNLSRHMNVFVKMALKVINPLFLKTAPQGAATQVYLLVHPDAAKVNGEYYSDCNAIKPTKNGQDDAMAAKLWKVSEEIVAKLP